MYSEDSFFDLTLLGRTGLLFVSATMAMVFVLASRRLFRAFPLWARVLGALFALWLFTWISPQVYYQYYHLLFPDLPNQWVIWPPPWPGEALENLLFIGRNNLSAHGKGVLGWVLIAVQIFPLRRGGRTAPG